MEEFVGIEGDSLAAIVRVTFIGGNIEQLPVQFDVTITAMSNGNKNGAGDV